MLPVVRRVSGRGIRERVNNSLENSLVSNEVASKAVVVQRWLGKVTKTPSRSLRTASIQSAAFQDDQQQRNFSIGPKRIQISKERQEVSDRVAIDFDSSKTPMSYSERVLFDLAKSDSSMVPVGVLLRAFKNGGLWKTDPRLIDTTRTLNKYTKLASQDGHSEPLLNEESFHECIKHNPKLVRQALTGDFVIPDFPKFCKTIDEIYSVCRRNRDGQVADYIPQLARYSPDLWAVSVCSVDGQRHAIGDVGVPFTVQSSGKPINYAIALNELGSEYVHRYIGHEPSGEPFNYIKLSPENKPHNPMINPGAIVVSSLIRQDLSLADRFDFILTQYKRAVGNEYLGFNNAVFLSEKETANRNFAIAHYLKENRCFPEKSSLKETMDLYFQLCSIEINANSGAVIAATLANGGRCPITGDEVFSPQYVRNTLALMHSCGMYDYSGGFAFKVGLPAKSSVSGVIFLVVPNVVGICLWSPPLERMGNSVRGVQFCEELVKNFQFHPYDSSGSDPVYRRTDPRIRKSDMEADQVVDILFGAYNGDLTALRRLALSRKDMTTSDYDGRTALHIAAAEGHIDCVQFLVDECQVPVTVFDRWGSTPLDDAVKFNQMHVQRFLESALQKN